MLSHVSKPSELSLVKGLLICSKKLNYARAHARKMTVRTYWRDSHNPYPGKLIETKVVKIKDRPFARSDFDLMMDAKDERDIKTAAETAEQFEALVDSAVEGGYQ